MESSKKLKAQINPQGWQQFLTGLKDLLDSYDRARVYSKLHEVETYHGVVAEAQFRKWLSNFLPKKYAVTSGYIISQGLPDTEKIPHYDVIIYDCLESPILWIEDHSDVSEHGRSRAIPVEYVTAVLEIKSRFNSKTVSDAVNHLQDLKKLMESEDDENEPYKVYLPKNFTCGLVFFELKQENTTNIAALDKLCEAVDLKGFMGGIILRGEHRMDNCSGALMLMVGDDDDGALKMNQSQKRNYANINMINNVSTNSKLIFNGDKKYHCFALLWRPSEFSTFAFNLIALMNGTYRSGFIPSFHGFGGYIANNNK
ncbi:MAG: hypothetical protein JWR38_1970 [Mucilaginibacter sp.]|nr:hypothetical protein [Mucilaginibacter sp.]